MGANSKIQWTHHTFNPWRGCTKVSDGCKNCYAETMSKRNPKVLGIWGPRGTRVVASEAMWREPVKWNAEATAAGERRRVFCASLADVFEDRPDLFGARHRLFRLIDTTPYLDWLLLTKRPENIARMYEDIPDNVWLGTSCEDQATADERIPHLLKCPAAVRFVSAEPLLGPIDLNHEIGGTRWIGGQRGCGGTHVGVGTPECPRERHHHHDSRCNPGIDWVIVGGESGPGARPCDVAWIRSIRDQCKAAGVACFIKQLGAYAIVDPRYARAPFPATRKLADPKGGDMDEWPEDLKVREFPK